MYICQLCVAWHNDMVVVETMIQVKIYAIEIKATKLTKNLL